MLNLLNQTSFNRSKNIQCNIERVQLLSNCAISCSLSISMATKLMYSMRSSWMRFSSSRSSCSIHTHAICYILASAVHISLQHCFHTARRSSVFPLLLQEWASKKMSHRLRLSSAIEQNIFVTKVAPLLEWMRITLLTYYNFQSVISSGISYLRFPCGLPLCPIWRNFQSLLLRSWLCRLYRLMQHQHYLCMEYCGQPMCFNLAQINWTLTPLQCATNISEQQQQITYLCQCASNCPKSAENQPWCYGGGITYRLKTLDVQLYVTLEIASVLLARVHLHLNSKVCVDNGYLFLIHLPHNKYTPDAAHLQKWENISGNKPHAQVVGFLCYYFV